MVVDVRIKKRNLYYFQVSIHRSHRQECKREKRRNKTSIFKYIRCGWDVELFAVEYLTILKLLHDCKILIIPRKVS